MYVMVCLPCRCPASINALLPLFVDSAHTVAMIRHSMVIVKAAIMHVNSRQVPVLAAEHPLFALAKEIQWTWPSTHGEDIFVTMFGGLHIEVGVLKVSFRIIYGNSQCWTYQIPVHVVVTATLFHQCSLHVHLATEIVGSLSYMLVSYNLNIIYIICVLFQLLGD